MGADTSENGGGGSNFYILKKFDMLAKFAKILVLL